jgi:phosphoglycolate phosphatase
VPVLLSFDYDGVLVDSLDDLIAKARAAHRLLAAEGEHVGTREPSREDFLTTEELTLENIAKRIGMPSSTIQSYADKFFELQQADPGDVRAFPGIPRVVKELAQQHVIVVVTSSSRSAVRRILARSSLADCVSLIYGGTQPGSKAEKISLAREEFGAAPDDTYMIGDTVSDMRYGKAAGVKTIAVTWGFHARDLLLRESPDHLADSPDDLLTILARE